MRSFAVPSSFTLEFLYVSFNVPSTPQAIASCSIQTAGNPSCLITKVLNQHTPTTVNDNCLPPRFTLCSLHQFGLFRRFRPSFRQAPSTPARHFPHEPECLSCIHIRFHDSCRPLYRSFWEQFPPFFQVRPYHAWLPSRPLVANAGPHPVHVRSCFFTRSFFAPRSH